MAERFTNGKAEASYCCSLSRLAAELGKRLSSNGAQCRFYRRLLARGRHSGVACVPLARLHSCRLGRTADHQRFLPWPFCRCCIHHQRQAQDAIPVRPSSPTFGPPCEMVVAVLSRTLADPGEMTAVSGAAFGQASPPLTALNQDCGPIPILRIAVAARFRIS